ncbi:malto-oligosyltrehalose synthase [Granulicella arctica]|uniref:(1->4)-alpha-D-glucan 1-alpha-D-glucosylmutase n=1 Tax=Granulicella arctica TaxID=940613 RepID=A0A7Y9TGE5_9BACT|nr:malto-oligosyltrehalose synthase [Granulicella arctica]NYF79404.1 (1->4)-alpha-D-glucan 1-alpha-D-glucosylmutase [Granulicella arctica]
MKKLRTPNTTYRVQLHKDFTFDDAAGIVAYLHALGVTHIYCSPYLQASPGSMHGYDVVDHQRVNDELGGRAAHGRFCRTIGELGLGQVLDIVPNHMSLGRENRYWWDVLENGTSSQYASFFDIDWQPQEERLRDKVLVPVLADQYGRVLQAGGIKVVRHGNSFLVEAASQTLPVSPRSLPAILARAAEYAKSDTLSFLAASFGRLPEAESWDRWKILARHRDKIVLRKLLDRLCSEEPNVCDAIERSVAELNGNLNGLDDFLNQQNYRLAYWKAADQQLGYRRFFDVNTLIGLRVEREHVFEETHALILDWLGRGVLDGVRVDHPDGLRDPLEYFRRLREAAPGAWIIGEKILEPGEFLREDWPIEGTSGYDFLNVVNGVLVRPEGLAELSSVYADFTNEPTDFHEIAHEKKINVTQEALGSDVNRLTSLFVEICEDNRNERDYTRAEMRRAIREVAACFQVYRTYVVPERGEMTAEDRNNIAQATECAKQKRQDIDGGLFDFLRGVLTMEVKGKRETEFVMRFQQFTSPVMAKGVEDTAFYCYNRLTGLNEVGSDPGRNGVSVDEFHSYCAKMQATHPLTMTTLSTHDTKRSDDVRARLAVLSEIPGKFGIAVQRWARLNSSLRTSHLLDRNTEYFYYQTLIGAWPLTLERAKAYMLKAAREAKQQTTWVANNKEFEDALNQFIEATFASPAFIEKVEQFVERVKGAGRVNSLVQTLLKYTSPGVPDLYQGSELWDLSLVDPDNRRPVDYELRRRLLKEIHALPVAEAAATSMRRMDDGLPKLWTIHRALQLRREHPEWFGVEASYTPLEVDGKSAQHVVAYLRGESVVTVVPRLTLTLGGAWQKTMVLLPEGRWINRLTSAVLEGGRVAVETLLKEFPVALLTREAQSHA